MKKLFVAAFLASIVPTAACAAEMPKEVRGTWCQVSHDSETFQRGPCAGKGLQRTISARGFTDSNNMKCEVSTVEPADHGWDIDFGCQYSKQRLDHGYARFLIFSMTGNRLGMRETE